MHGPIGIGNSFVRITNIGDYAVKWYGILLTGVVVACMVGCTRRAVILTVDIRDRETSKSVQNALVRAEYRYVLEWFRPQPTEEQTNSAGQAQLRIEEWDRPLEINIQTPARADHRTIVQLRDVPAANESNWKPMMTADLSPGSLEVRLFKATSQAKQ
jgi:hypothetical protein